MSDVRLEYNQNAHVHLNEMIIRLSTFAKSLRLRSSTIFLIVTVLLAISIWITILSPIFNESRSAWSALRNESGDDELVATNRPPQFPGLMRVKTLDPTLLPRPSKDKAAVGSSKRRLIFIGDIHGCKRELERLLEKVKFQHATDHIIAVGDVVSKGPDSLGVVDLLRSYGASCVRGNHDDRLLLTAESLRSKEIGAKSDKDVDEVGSTKLDQVQRLAMSLNNHHLQYLQSCPVILRIGHVEAFGGEAIAVHAGLVPGMSLDSQDPSSVMNMRSIDLATHVPTSKHAKNGSVAWYKLWNRYQQLLPLYQLLSKSNKGKPSGKAATVIYGHDAKANLQIHRYSKGLDTRCVYGGKLTALVVDGYGKQQIVHVKAKRDYTA